MIRLNDRLLLGGPDGVTIFSSETLEQLTGAQTDLDVIGLEAHAEAPSGSVLAHLADGSARTLTVREDEILVSGAYASTPWFAGSARLRDVLVRLGSDRSTLTVSTFGEARAVGADAMEMLEAEAA